MDFEAISRIQKWVLLLGSSYCAYRVYVAVNSLKEMAAETSETIGIVTKDLNKLFDEESNNSGEIPHSLKQLAKLANTVEILESLRNMSDAISGGIMKGMARAYRTMSIEERAGCVNAASFFLDKLFSKAGTEFGSAVAGSFAKNFIVGYLSVSGSKAECKRFVEGCIKVFVSTAVRVYLKNTMDANAYNDLFIQLANPPPTHHHHREVKDMLASICNGNVGSTSASTCNELDPFAEEASTKEMDVVSQHDLVG